MNFFLPQNPGIGGLDELTPAEETWLLSGTNGVVLLAETSAPTQTSGYGKLYVKSSDSNLYFLDDSGNETQLNAGGTGDVVGPASSTDNAIARFDSTTGKLLQNSGVTIDDSDNIATTGSVTTTELILNGTSFTGEEIARNLSTSIITLSGEGVSANADPTKFDISGGTGIIVDNHTDPTAPVIYKVSWSSQQGISVSDLTADSYIVSIDKNGTVHQDQYQDFFNAGHSYDRIHIGGYATTGAGIGAVGTEVAAAGNLGAVIYQFLHYFGSFNISGNEFYNEFSDLSISKTAGLAWANDGNYLTDKMNPNVVSSTASSNITYFLQYRDGAGGFTTTTGSTIDVGHYDDGDGTLGVVNTNQWQVFRIYFRPENDNTIIMYGQTIYNSKADAIASLPTDIPTLSEAVGYNVFCNWLVARGGATDLSDTGDAEFITANQHGTVGGGGSTPLASIQDVYNHSDEPEILTDATRGAVTIQGGTGTDTDNSIEIKNNAGTTVATLKANGTLTLPNTGLVVGTSTPFSDSAGTLTLQNIDALDATTEATIESAIDTLANLTSIQGNTVALTGDFIRSGAHSLTFTTTATTDVTLPASGTLATLAGSETFSGKRITKRTATTNAPGATPTTNSDNVDIQIFTGLNAAITSMTTNLSGTPATGDLLMFWLTDDGTGRAITWGASFSATTVALPTTTVASTRLRVLFQWDGSTWNCIASV